MVWLSNPLTMPFMYYVEYTTGVYLLGMEHLVVEPSLEWFENNFSHIFIPLYVGTLFYMLTLSPLVYAMSIGFGFALFAKERKRGQKKKQHLFNAITNRHKSATKESSLCLQYS